MNSRGAYRIFVENGGGRPPSRGSRPPGGWVRQHRASLHAVEVHVIFWTNNTVLAGRKEGGERATVEACLPLVLPFSCGGATRLAAAPSTESPWRSRGTWCWCWGGCVSRWSGWGSAGWPMLLPDTGRSWGFFAVGGNSGFLFNTGSTDAVGTLSSENEAF